MNDSQLLHGLVHRDPAAVKHLSECYLPSVWRFVYAQVRGDRHLAEDIVSETVLALIRTVSESASEIVHPAAWLRTVASRKISDHFRAAARVKHLVEQVQQTVDTADHNRPDSRQELAERREAIRGVMNQLGESQRLVLEWKYIDRLSVKEIASRLDQSEKATESLLFRARREFKERLERTSQASIHVAAVQGNQSVGQKSVRETSSPAARPSENGSGESKTSEEPGEVDLPGTSSIPGNSGIESETQREIVGRNTGCDAHQTGRR